MVKNRSFLFYVSLVLVTVFVSGLWADSLDIDDDQEVLTFASKRGTTSLKLVSLEQANRMVKKGYTQTELNFLVYDESKDKLKNVYNEGKVKGGQKFTINVRGYERPQYLYVYRVNAKNEVEKLFPTKKGHYYKENPIRKYVDYTLPFKETEWLSFSKKKGTENFYFFVSQKPIRSFHTKKLTLKKDLDNMLSKHKGTSYNASVNKKKEVKVKYEVYPSTVWFKEVYANKIIVKNNG